MGKQLQTTTPADNAGMTVDEVRRFEQLDGRIERGIRSFVEVGQALAEVRDFKLYRRDFGTFEAYCESKGLSRPRAYELMAAVEVAKNLSGMPDIDLNARQANELAKLPADQQADAFIEASERTNGKPTAAAIKQVVAERTQTFGDIPDTAEPTAADDDNARPEPDEDEAERKAEGKRYTERSPFDALKAAETPLTFSPRCRTDARILALEISEKLGSAYAACVISELAKLQRGAA